jgi:CheY-like chemotaxis protein
MTGPTLRDYRILVVEDEYILAMDLQNFLEDNGAVVVGPAPSVGQAMALIRSGMPIEAAIVDVNLGGEMAFPVADALTERRIPFVFASGYADDTLQERYPDARTCKKPYGLHEIARTLTDALTASFRRP